MDTTGAQSNGANPNFSGTTADGSYAAGGGQAASSPGQQVTLQNGGVNQFGGTQLNPSSPLPEVPQTQDASAISQGTQPIQFPSNQPDTGVTASNANSANTSIPNPATIINQETQQTPAEQTNNSLLSRLAGIMQGKSSLATLQTQQEATAGVPAMTKTLNDLNTQLQGLNDQSSALALNAGPGGTIQNQEQNQAQGRGVTTQGLAPLSAGDLRNNQIQQAAVAAQALVTFRPKGANLKKNYRITDIKAAYASRPDLFNIVEKRTEILYNINRDAVIPGIEVYSEMKIS